MKQNVPETVSNVTFPFLDFQALLSPSLSNPSVCRSHCPKLGRRKAIQDRVPGEAVSCSLTSKQIPDFAGPG